MAVARNDESLSRLRVWSEAGATEWEAVIGLQTTLSSVDFLKAAGGPRRLIRSTSGHTVTRVTGGQLSVIIKSVSTCRSPDGGTELGGPALGWGWSNRTINWLREQVSNPFGTLLVFIKNSEVRYLRILQGALCCV